MAFWKDQENCGIQIGKPRLSGTGKQDGLEIRTH